MCSVQYTEHMYICSSVETNDPLVDILAGTIN